MFLLSEKAYGHNGGMQIETHPETEMARQHHQYMSRCENLMHPHMLAALERHPPTRAGRFFEQHVP